MILLGVVAQLCSQQGQVGFAIAGTEWPCVAAALLKGADAINQVSEIFYSGWGAGHSFSRQEFYNHRSRS